jgi:hypothetical protein
MPAMSLRRGLLRLWVICSIAWIVAVGYDAYLLWPTPVRPWTVYQALGWSNPVTKEPRTKEDLLDEFVRLRMRGIVRSHVEWAFGPPVAVIVIGAALWWAAAGFRRK